MVQQLSREQFEARWATVQAAPTFQPAPAKPAQINLSLSTFLDQYLANAAQSRDRGQLTAADYAQLDAAISALKGVLTRINDDQLVAGWAAEKSNTIHAQMAARTAALR
jgi:hypothetical protein